MAISQARVQPQGIRPLGASLPGLHIKTKGLPSRPNELLISRRGIEGLRNGSSLSSTGSPYDASQVEDTPDHAFPTKSLPAPPALAALRPPRGSSLNIMRDSDNHSHIPRPMKIRPVPIDTTNPREDMLPAPLSPEANGPSSRSSSNYEANPSIQTVQEDGSSDFIPSPLPPQMTDMIVPPITKIHFSCYQSHRSMPVTNNAWYSVPCMTCSKMDQEVRYRCIFCCLRICGDCFENLQKCTDRSLTEFMAMHDTS
jgi:hypothetical protein